MKALFYSKKAFSLISLKLLEKRFPGMLSTSPTDETIDKYLIRLSNNQVTKKSPVPSKSKKSTTRAAAKGIRFKGPLPENIKSKGEEVKELHEAEAALHR